MTRTKAVLAVGLGLVALFALTAGASAKGKGALPDLVVTKVSKPPASKVVGAKLKLVVKVKNKGTAAAGKSRLGVYLAKGKKHKAKDKRLKRVKVKPLAAGKKAKLKVKLTLPAKTAAGNYRLIACTDDTKKVKESKEGNCVASKAFAVTAKVVPVPGAPALSMTDGIDWGFVDNAAGETPEPGDPITATLQTANGLPGQAGYTRTAVAASGFLAGTSTELKFNGTDDSAAAVALPFAFPFAGVNETSVSVGTNGWVSFGSPAVDYWEDNQTADYRGVAAVLGEFERGIMPYWGDLDLNPGPSSVRVVSAPGSVAFQWDVSQHTTPGRRSLQLVLFPDGSFRFDYPGENAPGGNKSFVGFSPGTGASSAEIVSVDGVTVPATSLLFTPKAVTAGELPAGQVSVTLPAGSSLISADPGCALAQAAGPFTPGLVTCPTPLLAVGQQTLRNVTFATPPNAPGQASPANLRFAGSYLSGSFALTDSDEIGLLSTALRPTTLEVNAQYNSPTPPKPGTLAYFDVQFGPITGGGLDEPVVNLTLPTNTKLSAVELDGDPADCDPPVGAQVTCRLPLGISSGELEVALTPKIETEGTTLTLGATIRALNASAVSDSATSPPVEVK